MISQNKTVMVTGTSRGLGLAIALDLTSSHRVVGIARNPLAMSGGDSRFSRIEHLSNVDVRNAANLDKLAPRLAECDALVNNVGIAYDGILAMQSLQSIEEIVQVNLVSLLYLTKLYVRERLAVSQPGNVVTIGSIVAIRGYRGLAAYSASKGALSSMTRALAREMGAKGFRFNTVLPGFIETDMSRSLSGEQRKQIIRRTPLGRLAKVDDVVPIVRFLLSEDSRFITGQEIIVDGGITS